MPFLMLTLLIMAFLFWLAMLVEIISMKEEDFEGPNDKLIFFILVFFGNIFGAILFWFLRPQKREEISRLVDISTKPDDSAFKEP